MSTPSRLSVVVLCLSFVPSLRAEPKDEVAGAAARLGEKPNYSWTSTIETTSRFNFGPIEGQTEKGGATHLRLQFRDNSIEVVLKDGKGAIKSQDGWQSLDELIDSDSGQENRGRRFMARMLKEYKTPAADAAQLAKDTTALANSDDAIAGELTEDGARQLLLFRPRSGDAPQVSNAKGSAKFWVKDGQLVKYQYTVQGSVRFNDNDVDVDRTATVEIKDVGSTKVEIPAEAKDKL